MFFHFSVSIFFSLRNLRVPIFSSVLEFAFLLSDRFRLLGSWFSFDSFLSNFVPSIAFFLSNCLILSFDLPPRPAPVGHREKNDEKIAYRKRQFGKKKEIRNPYKKGNFSQGKDRHQMALILLLFRLFTLFTSLLVASLLQKSGHRCFKRGWRVD
jgi:hypothetical protein